MIINRHNYEEFFLLYIDKELDEVQQTAVEKFVQQNPDLGKELEMLKQSILSNDNVRFEAKDILYKKEAGISLVNYEEYFLLSVDNELSREQIAEVEKFVSKHPQLQHEFTLLKQTMLARETIQFPKKQVLYRTEKKRRVIPLTAMKMSIAAAITGLVAALWLFTQNNNAPGNKNNLATKEQQVKNYRIKVTESPKALIDQPVAKINERVRNKKILEQAKTSIPFKRDVKNSIAQANTTKVLKQNSNEAFPENNLAGVQTQKQSEEKLPATVTETRKNLNSSSSSKLVSENAANTTFASDQNAEAGKLVAKQAVYNEINNDDEDRSIYIGATEFNKNKLKSFLKRAANLFDKKGNRSETERTVQIASFEIKSK
ncbi:MAG: hypothetical protein H0X70_00325 [Segetibacter sp.]|nr:hypothetical protein [Segetibacter sp.]